MSKINLKGKKVTVMGLGLNGGGVGVVKYLVSEKANVIVTDIKTEKDLKPSLEKLKKLKGVTYILGQHRVEDFTTADLIIKNPSIKDSVTILQQAIQAGVPVDTPLGLFFQKFRSPIVGITGTRGKTTTTTLVYNMIKKQWPNAILGGNIGISPLEALSKLKEDTPVVLELSSWQVEAIAKHKKSPHLAVITNIYPDHLNFYKNYEEYKEAKYQITDFQNKYNVLVLNHDNDNVRRISERTKATIAWFSTKKIGSPRTCFCEGKSIMYRDKDQNLEPLASLDDIKIPGSHNLENVLAACVAAKAFDVKSEYIQKAIQEMKGIPNRIETIAEKNGIEFINDTTSTTPTSLEVALKAMTKPTIIIAGGTDKRLVYDHMKKLLSTMPKSIVWLKGTATDKMIKMLELAKKPIQHTSMHNAVQDAYSQAKEGDVILLSPGAASFGIFQNEFDRGDQFKKEVNTL